MDTNLVAIVDDEESVRRALGRLIRAAGFAVETYSSGADFLDAVSRRVPQCAVLDLRMPALSGFDVLENLLRLGSPVPVVIMTGDDSLESRERTLKLGARAYLRKPVDEAMLLEALHTAMRSHA
jgi:FixJ family two-component response regulator